MLSSPCAPVTVKAATQRTPIGSPLSQLGGSEMPVEVTEGRDHRPSEPGPESTASLSGFVNGGSGVWA